MATNPVSRKWTFEEYLVYEEEIGIKHEFLDGEIYMMSGGTKRHTIISANCIRILGNQLLESDCYTTTSDMRIQVSPTKYVYPDFSVVCGAGEFTDDKEITLTNPTLVAEVMSDSSEKYDKGLKSEFYRKLSSLQNYLLIDQNRVHVQLYTRQGDGWFMQEFEQHNQTISLEAVDVRLPVSEIYRGIDFESNETSDQ